MSSNLKSYPLTPPNLNNSSTLNNLSHLPKTPPVQQSLNEFQFNSALNHPASLDYFAGHPRRQKIFFGPYLLLNTLG